MHNPLSIVPGHPKNGVLLVPFESGANPYINCLRKVLSKDFDVYSLADIRKHPHWTWTRLRGVYLNWIENDPKIRNIWMLRLFRLLGIRLVWTHHNKRPHDRPMTWKGKKFIDFLERSSDTIIIHCHESLSFLPEHCHSRVQFFPHGNYIGCYPPAQDANVRQELGIPNDAVVFLFLGHVKRYKGIDVLLEAFGKMKSSRVHLIVAGMPDAGKSMLRDLMPHGAAGSRIHQVLRWVPDGEIRGYLDAADAVVMPLDQKSSLNSGSVLMAFSHGKTVIAPWMGTLLEYKDQPPFFYAYDYATREEHVQMLAETMERALQDERTSPGHLRHWGEMALGHVRSENDWESFRPILRRIFGHDNIGVCN